MYRRDRKGGDVEIAEAIEQYITAYVTDPKEAKVLREFGEYMLTVKEMVEHIAEFESKQ